MKKRPRINNEYLKRILPIAIASFSISIILYFELTGQGLLIDDSKKSEPLVIILITSLSLALFLLPPLINFFKDSYKNSSSNSGEYETLRAYVSNKKDDFRKEAEESYKFLDWIIKNNLNTDYNVDNLKQAKSLKEIYDYTDKLGDEKDNFLNILKSYINELPKLKNDNDIRFEHIKSIFYRTQKRLDEECNRLNRQAVLNLYLAFVMALILIIYIIISVFSFSSFNLRGWTGFLIHYIPRLISFASIITIFLYFIKLYKTNIIDVKYYQNELTNIEQKYLALEVAIANDNNEAVIEIIKDFSTTDRNVIITNDQKSLEIERIKLENEINKGYLDKFFDLFSFFKKTEKTDH